MKKKKNKNKKNKKTKKIMVNISLVEKEVFLSVKDRMKSVIMRDRVL